MATFTGADKAIGFLFDMVANIADDYSASSSYSQGAYTIYSGTLYKCISAISTPEDFTPAHWQAVLIMDEVAAGGGGGGGGTTVIANPAGAATDTLNKLQVGATIYDVPSGGGSSGHTWSTTEHIVGTWIDGKTVYEKTINIGAMIQDTSWHGTPHGISNLLKIISFEGYVINDTGTEFSAATFFRPVRNTGVAFYATSTTISYMNSYIACSECYVTLQYLKSA